MSYGPDRRERLPEAPGPVGTAGLAWAAGKQASEERGGSREGVLSRGCSCLGQKPQFHAT